MAKTGGFGPPNEGSIPSPAVDLRDLHWLAGLLEGEGTFIPGPPSNPRMPVIQVEMVDADVMARVGRLLGRKVTTLRARRAEWSATYQVKVTGGPAVGWMLHLHPLMGERRQRQIERALRCYEPLTTRILSDADVAVAIAMLAAGRTVREVAEHFVVSIWCVYDLKLGRTHKDADRSALLAAKATA
jgi:hypothetical protein